MLKKLKSQFGSSLKRLLSSPAAASPTQTVADLHPAPSVSARATADPAGRARRQRRLQLRSMRYDLYDLMGQHADSRRMLRHLGLVERTLRKEGLAAVEALPRPVIDKALEQLESLVHDWSREGLADLRSRMAVMLRDQPPAGPLGSDLASDDDHDEMAPLERGLTVTVELEDLSETDHAAFAEMERSWAGRMPTGLGAARSARDGS